MHRREYIEKLNSGVRQNLPRRASEMEIMSGSSKWGRQRLKNNNNVVKAVGVMRLKLAREIWHPVVSSLKPYIFLVNSIETRAAVESLVLTTRQ